jgi:predicted methyltransferase
MLKVCTKCKEALPLSDFRKQSSTKDGLKYYCKKCDNELAKSYYKKNKNKIVDKVKEWQKANPEKVKGYKKSYYGKNKSVQPPTIPGDNT